MVRNTGPESTVLPAKSDSDVMFCLQNDQGLRIDRSLVYQSYAHAWLFPLKILKSKFAVNCYHFISFHK